MFVNWATAMALLADQTVAAMGGTEESADDFAVELLEATTLPEDQLGPVDWDAVRRQRALRAKRTCY